jgi:hypothetical protein
MRKYEDVACPTCGAEAGRECTSLSDRPYVILIKHKARRALSQDEPVPRRPASP